MEDKPTGFRFYHLSRRPEINDFHIPEAGEREIGDFRIAIAIRSGRHQDLGTASPQLPCTQKDHALVEYAIAGMDNRLFVSMYQLE